MSNDRRPLDQLRVVSPCPKTWHELDGEGQKRFCNDCNKHVHNLSGMTRRQVDDLVEQTGCKICVHYIPDANGNPLTLSDRPVGYRIRYRVAHAFAFAVGLFLLLGGATQARANWTDRVKAYLDSDKFVGSRTGQTQYELGDMAVPIKKPVPTATVGVPECPAPKNRVLGKLVMPTKRK